MDVKQFLSSIFNQSVAVNSTEYNFGNTLCGVSFRETSRVLI